MHTLYKRNVPFEAFLFLFNTFVSNFIIMKKILLFSFLAIFLNSCTEIETSGCIDPYAYNYESFADYDDGSCLYTSDVVFYEDVAAAVYFDILGVEWLDLSVDGIYIGTLDATLGLTYVADCFESDAIVFALDWVDASSSSFTWVIRDETGFIHYEGIEVVLPNDCLPIGLTFKKITDYKESRKKKQ